VNKADELNRLRQLQKELEKSKEQETRKANFQTLKQLAIADMKANRERTWYVKQIPNGFVDTVKKAELDRKVNEAHAEFVKKFQEFVGNNPRNRRWWGAELQKAYIQGAPQALLVNGLSDDSDQSKPLAWTLKRAADDYIRGWAMLNRKDQATLPGPLDVTGNGALAVQLLIEQLKDSGDEINETQAQILEIEFEDPISALGQKNIKTEGFTLGETLEEKSTTSSVQ